MKKVPFYANRPDKDDSCMLASIRAALEYFTGKSYSWKDIEELTGYQPHKAAWTVQAWTRLAAQGFSIRMIEGFDYKRYLAEGKKYLAVFLKPHEVQWQLDHTNLLEIRPFIPQFLKTVHHELKRPQLTDIDQMLADGYLVTVQLNSKALNDKPGYSAHMILVYDKAGDDYVAHDPGLPPHANRRIPRQKLWEAMGGADNTVEVTGIQLANGKA